MATLQHGYVNIALRLGDPSLQLKVDYTVPLFDSGVLTMLQTVDKDNSRNSNNSGSVYALASLQL